MVNAAGDLEVGQARVWTCVGTPCDWQWTWSTYRDSNGTLLEVDLENTQMASAELNFNWPTGMNNSSIVEEAYLNVYINDWTSASPRVWNHALHAERAMRWHGRYPGRGWVVTPNLKDIVAQEVQSGANPILLYLEPGAFDIPFIFRAWDHSDHSFAPVLGIRYRNTGGSGQTENPTVVYQHGVNGYTGGEDTHIVSTTWEPPTPHDTFPTLYVRTNSTENEVFSSIIRFNGVSLPPGVEVTNAMLAVYFNGQSVNGGSIGVHVAGPYPDWLAPQTTWTHYRTNQNWQANGAKGVEDRGLYVSERVVNYTDVGKWLYFNVTDLVQEGVYEYVLYGLHRGTNKDIKLPSNEYWDATKRPKLMIWYE